MMSSCTIRLMMPTDQLFTTTDLVVSYVKKSVTKPQRQEPIAARQCVSESKDDECEREVQLRFSLQGRPWKVHFHSSLWRLLISLIKYLMVCSNRLVPLPPCLRSLAEIHQTHLPRIKNVPPWFFLLISWTTKKYKGQLNYISLPALSALVLLSADTCAFPAFSQQLPWFTFSVHQLLQPSIIFPVVNVV